MVKGNAGNHVDVFESQPGNLRAKVVSDFFKGIGVSERQERIWAYLNERLSEEQLRRLYGVHPYDVAEYAMVSPVRPTTATSSVSYPVRLDAHDSEASE